MNTGEAAGNPIGKKPNMAAIAREAGVGKATVSLALRNDPRLRLETRERIQEVAQKMGYRANAVVSTLMAQLRASRTPKFQATIGILNASPARDWPRSNFTSRAWMAGIRRRSEELGYTTDEFWLGEPGLGVARLGQILRARNIRGVVIAGVLEHREIGAEFDPLWGGLASAVVGVRPERPQLHFASNDQFSTAFRAAIEIRRLGYRRPGLIIDPAIDENIDWRFSSGFLAGWRPADGEAGPCSLDFVAGARERFRSWHAGEKPDIIVSTHPEVRGWMEEIDLQIPRDIGLVHLDLTPEIEGWSGMNQNNNVVGDFAIDLVVGQLHRNEIGVPARPKAIMTESSWVAGDTTRPQDPADKPAKKRRR